METKVTVIVDNMACGGIAGEWGLSLLVEYADKKILLDTGASELFAKNMKKLGFKIGDIDYAVLSHAHYDHANGMSRFFKENSRANFYLRETAEENCYFKKFIFHRYIGIPRHILTNYSERIKIVSGDYELMKGVYLIPHKTKGLEAIGKREMMYQRTSSGWKPDDFSHEQSLVIDTDKGLVIINCCSHGGAVNIINEVSKTFPDKHVYGLIGGFHLFNKSDHEVRDVAKKIQDTGIDFVCTGHCTKKRAYRIMKEELRHKLEQLKVGLSMKFSLCEDAEVKIVRANIDNAKEIHAMQVEAFQELLEKYQDYDTNPASEGVENVEARLKQDFTFYYFICIGQQKVGTVRIVDQKEDGKNKRISPICILPEFQGKGIAQKAIRLCEEVHGNENWELDTILQEPKNCHLYEKMGYRQTGKTVVINERLTLISYEKRMDGM